VAEFPELKEALYKWANEAISRLSADDESRDIRTDLGRWQCDSDGIFRDAEREMEVWNRKCVDNLFDLPQWATVLDVLHATDRLEQQLDTFVGTAKGGRHLEAASIGRVILPRPNELGQFDVAFEKRYAELEDFLAVDEVEYTVIWPLPGLVSAVLPLQLDSMLELDAMSDRELEFALNNEVIWTVFPVAGSSSQRLNTAHAYDIVTVSAK